MENENSYKIHIRFKEIEVEIEGDKDFVERNLDKIFSELNLEKDIQKVNKVDLSKTAGKLQRKKNNSFIIKEKKSKENIAIDQNSIENDSEFYNWIKSKNANTIIDNILLIIYWLYEKQIKYFSPKDVLNYWMKTGKSELKNINQYFKYISSENKNFIKNATRGEYSLTDIGLIYIKENLLK